MTATVLTLAAATLIIAAVLCALSLRSRRAEVLLVGAIAIAVSAAAVVGRPYRPAPPSLDDALQGQAELPTNHKATDVAAAAFLERRLSPEQSAAFMRSAAPRFSVELLAQSPPQHWVLDLAQTNEQAVPGKRWNGLDCDVEAEVLVNDRPAGPRILLDFAGPTTRPNRPFCSGLAGLYGSAWMQLSLQGTQPPFGSTVTLRLHATTRDARTGGNPIGPSTQTSDHRFVIPAAFPPDIQPQTAVSR